MSAAEQIPMNQPQRICVLKALRLYRDDVRAEIWRLEQLDKEGKHDVKPDIELQRTEMECIDSVVRLIWQKHH